VGGGNVAVGGGNVAVGGGNVAVGGGNVAVGVPQAMSTATQRPSNKRFCMVIAPCVDGMQIIYRLL
jgi:hypothetical protein